MMQRRDREVARLNGARPMTMFPVSPANRGLARMMEATSKLRIDPRFVRAFWLLVAEWWPKMKAEEWR